MTCKKRMGQSSCEDIIKSFVSAHATLVERILKTKDGHTVLDRLSKLYQRCFMPCVQTKTCQFLNKDLTIKKQFVGVARTIKK